MCPFTIRCAVHSKSVMVSRSTVYARQSAEQTPSCPLLLLLLALGLLYRLAHSAAILLASCDAVVATTISPSALSATAAALLGRLGEGRPQAGATGEGAGMRAAATAAPATEGGAAPVRAEATGAERLTAEMEAGATEGETAEGPEGMVGAAATAVGVATAVGTVGTSRGQQ